MFIVYNLGEKHSAWKTKEEAENQIRVLNNYGYKHTDIDEIDCNYENGYYFV